MDDQGTSARPTFLSYASQDVAAAERICGALRQAGLEVWFDKGELRSGEAWDASIRRQVKGCHLFIPIISASTQAREEGYFRREWNLAVSRTLDMADDREFLLPVVIDATLEGDARVPEKFRDVQWTFLPAGEVPAAFIERVCGLTFDKPARSLAEPAPALPRRAATINIDRDEERTQRDDPRLPRRQATRALKLAVPAMLVVIAGLVLSSVWHKREHARKDLLPAIQDMVGTTFTSSAELFDMAVEVEKYLPADPILAKLWPDIATTMSIDTDPAGAEVFWKVYETPRANWRKAGVTPFKDVKVPRTYLRLEIRNKGYQTIEYATPGFDIRIPPTNVHLKMDALGSLPENMVRIPSVRVSLGLSNLLENGDKDVHEFLVDKFEVTNRQFKAFVDAGGYVNKSYWLFPIVDAGRVIPLDAALATFTDRTGRQGPSTWEAGSYPDGTADHPVTGVSWYEAAAYAAYASKQLPTVYHWSAVADASRSEFLIPLSNFNGRSTSAVGSMAGFSTYGIYDLAGNAREWVLNQGEDLRERFIMGGGWSDQSYAFNESYTQPALDRSNSNGFRCIKVVPGDVSMVALEQPISRAFRDYSKEKPVDDKTFANFARQFVYDKTALAAKVDKTIEAELWNLDVVSIDAGYNNERMQVYVYLPKRFTGAREAVIYFPGSGGIYQRQFDPAFINQSIVFIVKSGRALIVPIYKGTYERHDGLKSLFPDKTVSYKDHVIDWGKELGRTIDYLETRQDIQADRVAYLGFSWGGRMGGIFPAVEKRIKVIVLNVGGMTMAKTLPEVDGLNYLPRVTQPALMLADQYDMFYPLETAQKPMFNLLGTPKKDKKMVVYESGHMVPPNDYVKETLAWLDAYLGPAR